MPGDERLQFVWCGEGVAEGARREVNTCGADLTPHEYGKYGSSRDQYLDVWLSIGG